MDREKRRRGRPAASPGDKPYSRGLTVPAWLAERIREDAAAQGRTYNWVISSILKAHYGEALQP